MIFFMTGSSISPFASSSLAVVETWADDKLGMLERVMESPKRRSTLNPHPSIMWWIIQIYLCFSINAHKIIFIISVRRRTLIHTLTFARDGPGLVLINQYDAHDDEKVGIIQIISHKVIRFRIDEIFHLHVNSLMVLFDDWYHCDDSIPEE